MNICIVTSSFPVNRNELYHRYLDELFAMLLEKGHAVTVLTQEKEGSKGTFHPQVEVIWFPWKKAGNKALADISLSESRNIFSAMSLLFNGIKYCRSVGKEKKIDLFICQWVIPSGFYVFAKNILFKRTPYIVWALGSDIYNYKDNMFTRFLLRSIIKPSKAIFADGFELCDIVKKISGRECGFLPTFHKIDPPAVTAEETRIPGKEITFLYIGRLSRVKGVDVLIESFKLLQKEKDFNFKCYIIGEGEMMQTLTDEVTKHKLNEKIVFLGKITDEKEKARYFNLADCILIPSRSESIPIVLSEAVQFGRPVITTTAGDMELLVKKYNLGLVAEKENPASLADQMKKFMERPLHISAADRQALLTTLLFESSSAKLLSEISL